ncbi:uncharacterized protein LOC100843074 [Brachypodium distachyon]|uniref:C2 domain-containing protein n=1 Tax=Brachypodium distachyon TaxID=15368 RepID=I1IDU6_BRADI|nr:uncharacterized protein LOC100843074 [Brachypodium distachyon]KQK01328.1 hypothetical protein BRADI_3g55180v3 [Brachypodium distachyon]|eukprot:XP_003572941.1 uncharacterized protein LOC100843074 [Brachypodium distachyon]
MSAGGLDGCSPPPHLLEVTVISAQDLHRGRLGLGRRRVRAYAMAWTDGARKLRTGVDLAGGADPTWNDRFLFRVDPGFLRSETASVAVEVRGARSLLGGDAVLGHTRIVVSAFVSASRGDGRPIGGRQVAALQLRRPRSLRPQGIVNVAVALLDGATHAVPPVYNAPGSPDAFAVKDLMAVAARQLPPALGKIAEEDEEEGGAVLDHHGRRRRFVENSGPLDARGAAVEQSKLEMKLEKWKADLSPDHGEEGGRGGKSARRRRRRSSCFFGSEEDWER